MCIHISLSPCCSTAGVCYEDVDVPEACSPRGHLFLRVQRWDQLQHHTCPRAGRARP